MCFELYDQDVKQGCRWKYDITGSFFLCRKTAAQFLGMAGGSGE
jgi:hypothetical protein